jgi:hypothetical protein
MANNCCFPTNTDEEDIDECVVNNSPQKCNLSTHYIYLAKDHKNKTIFTAIFALKVFVF